VPRSYRRARSHLQSDHWRHPAVVEGPTVAAVGSVDEENGGSSTVATELVARPLSSETERRECRPILEFVAIEVDAQRLQLGDVILIDLPGQETKIEAQVVGHSPEVTRESNGATARCAPRCGSQVEMTS
jgi:hypothetical protein